MVEPKDCELWFVVEGGDLKTGLFLQNNILDSAGKGHTVTTRASYPRDVAAGQPPFVQYIFPADRAARWEFASMDTEEQARVAHAAALRAMNAGASVREAALQAKNAVAVLGLECHGTVLVVEPHA